MRALRASLVLVAAIVVVLSGSATAASPSASSAASPPDASTTPAGVLTPLVRPPWRVRAGSTRTVLDDGRVLVVGGGRNGHATVDVELWDPMSGTRVAHGTLPDGVWKHSATLLADGRVFIAGGYSGEASLDRAFILDPRTMKAEPTGPLLHRRQGHHAVLLPDGRVLVLGGVEIRAHGRPRRSSLVSAEIWHPATGRFSPAGSLGVISADPELAGVLPDGQALVTGPSRALSTDGEPMFDVAAAEVWDPGAGTFIPAWRLTERQTLESVALLPDGRALLIIQEGTCSGGICASTRCVDCREVAEIWDARTAVLAESGPLIDPSPGQLRFATPLEDGSIALTGGGDALCHLQGEQGCARRPVTMERWSPVTGAFRPAGTAPAAWELQAPPLRLADGRLLIGMAEQADRTVWALMIWDPATEAFRPAAPAEGLLGGWQRAVAMPDGGALLSDGDRWFSWEPVP